MCDLDNQPLCPHCYRTTGKDVPMRYDADSEEWVCPLDVTPTLEALLRRFGVRT